jgi:hypothetical protein
MTEDSTISVFYNNWEGDTSTAASGGTYRLNANGATDAKFTFVGTSVGWITANGPSYGMANVFIDGVKSGGTFDLYSAKQQWQVAISFTGLSAAQHTIEIEPLGTKNSASKGTGVVVDAFRGPITPIGMPVEMTTSGGEAFPLWLLVVPLSLLGLWVMGRYTL